MSETKLISRASVQQSILDLFDNPAYLEIGVSKGATFHSVKSGTKVAVDPKFKFDVPEAQAQNPGATYHRCISDAYFEGIAGPDDMFDLIFIDGLHTFDQTFRDFTNALAHLKPHGAIVLDDVYPASYTSSIRDVDVFHKMKAVPGAKPHGWAGDVYRLVFLMGAYFPSLTYRTIADNHGQTVVWRQNSVVNNQMTIEQISRLPYEAVLLNREIFNYKKLEDIIVEFKQSLA